VGDGRERTCRGLTLFGIAFVWLAFTRPEALRRAPNTASPAKKVLKKLYM
jgi:hypothetical protein